MSPLFRLFLAIVVLALLPVLSRAGEQITGRVVHVADGDTITILDSRSVEHKIRLRGIDAPESGQAFGTAARRHLSSLVAGKTVTVNISGKDRYQRELGTVYVGGVNINRQMVSSGYAWSYLDSTYSAEQAAAKASGRGLWSDLSPERPSEYRTRKTRESQTSTSSSRQQSPSTRTVTQPRPSTNPAIYSFPRPAPNFPPAPSYTPTRPSTGNDDVYVHGYYRSDGTYVRPHYRKRPGAR